MLIIFILININYFNLQSLSESKLFTLTLNINITLYLLGFLKKIGGKISSSTCAQPTCPCAATSRCFRSHRGKKQLVAAHTLVMTQQPMTSAPRGNGSFWATVPTSEKAPREAPSVRSTPPAGSTRRPSRASGLSTQKRENGQRRRRLVAQGRRRQE